MLIFVLRYLILNKYISHCESFIIVISKDKAKQIKIKVHPLSEFNLSNKMFTYRSWFYVYLMCKL